jgi:hypothetical protein
MVKPTQLMDHLDEGELRRRMKAAKDLDNFQRWQSIFLASRGLPLKLVTEYVGSTTAAVNQWVHQYNHYGPDGFERSPLHAPFSGFDHLP